MYEVQLSTPLIESSAAFMFQPSKEITPVSQYLREIPPEIPPLAPGHLKIKPGRETRSGAIMRLPMICSWNKLCRGYAAQTLRDMINE